jgi:hypothetical protein
MGDFYEDFRLEAAAAKSPTLEGIFSSVTEFCAGNPLSDDCTVVELCYTSVDGPESFPGDSLTPRMPK